MDGFLRSFFSLFQCRKIPSVLALLWTAGLLFGAMCAVFGSGVPVLTVRDAVRSHEVSFIWLILIRLFPLAFSSHSVFNCRSAILIPAVFLRAVVFSYTGACVVSGLGSSAWLIYWLLFFADTLIVTIHWFVWVCAFREKVSFSQRGLLFAAALIVLITIFDYLFVVPFLMKLI